MAKLTSPRTVQCYHCRHRFEVGARAQSTVCPKCNKPLMVADVVVKSLYHHGPVREIRTCGRIEVGKKGRIIADLVQAQDGVACLGTIECKRLISGAAVSLGPKAVLKGDVAAPVMAVQAGAQIRGGRFAVPEDPLGAADLPRKSR